DEVLPGPLPQPDDRRVPLAPLGGQVVDGASGGVGVDGGVEGPQVPLELIPVPLGGHGEGVAIRCMLCRYRHRVHYAEERIMPIWRAKALSRKDFALLNLA